MWVPDAPRGLERGSALVMVDITVGRTSAASVAELSRGRTAVQHPQLENAFLLRGSRGTWTASDPCQLCVVRAISTDPSRMTSSMGSQDLEFAWGCVASY